MTAISIETAGTRGGKQVVRATIVANTAPGTLPTTGEGIVGMTEDQVFAPMSMIYVVAANADPKLYIANEQGAFVAQ